MGPDQSSGTWTTLQKPAATQVAVRRRESAPDHTASVIAGAARSRPPWAACPLGTTPNDSAGLLVSLSVRSRLAVCLVSASTVCSACPLDCAPRLAPILESCSASTFVPVQARVARVPDHCETPSRHPAVVSHHLPVRGFACCFYCCCCYQS